MVTRLAFSVALLSSCFTVAIRLAAQPGYKDEPAIDLRRALEGLPKGDVADVLEAIRGLGSHRHLFKGPNTSKALPSLLLLLLHENAEVRQAAAVAFYLNRRNRVWLSLPLPGDDDEIGVEEILSRFFAKLGQPSRGRGSVLKLILSGSRSKSDRVRCLALHVLGLGLDEASHRRLRASLKSRDREERWRAAWALGYSPRLDARSRSILLECLDDEDRPVRTWATFALSRDKDSREQVYPRLVNILKKGTQDQKALAACELGSMGERGVQAVPFLVFVGDGCVPGLRKYFIGALAQLVCFSEELDEKALRFLVKGLSSGNLNTRLWATQALWSRDDLGLKAVEALLQSLVWPHKSPRNTEQWHKTRGLRRSAVDLLAAQKMDAREIVLPRLRKLAQSAEPHEEVFALIQRLGPRARPLRPELLACRMHSNPAIRREALKALSGLGDLSTDDVAVIVKALDDGNWMVREAAMEALGALGAQAEFAAEQLLKRADGESGTCAVALGRIAASSDRVLDLLLTPRKQLTSGAAKRRAAALCRSGRKNDPRVVGWLADALTDRRIRRSVMRGVQRLGSTDKRLVKRLEAFLDPRFDHDTRLYTAVCLATLGCSKDRIVPVLVSYLDDDVRAGRAASGLGRVQNLDRSAVIKVVGLLDNEFHRGTAVTALGNLGPVGEPAVPALLELLGDSSMLDLAVIEALGLIGRRPQHVVPVLVNCLDHDWVHCRTRAEGALLRFAEVAIPTLERAASSKSFVRARRARRVLQRIEDK